MRTIILSDAHGQPWLLENALRHADTYDRVIFAGDILDIGLLHDDCEEILSDVGAEMMWGNHEQAILLDKRITPQNPESFEWKGYLLGRYERHDWKAAIAVEDVLITHAGVCEDYQRLYGYCDSIEHFAEELDNRFHANAESWWDDDSPMWYRPNHSNQPLHIMQVCGHTPAMNVPSFENFYIIDPFGPGFNKKTYKYAVIENGAVHIEEGHIADGD